MKNLLSTSFRRQLTADYRLLSDGKAESVPSVGVHLRVHRASGRLGKNIGSAAAPKKRRRGRAAFATTADEFVQSFIKDKKNPTSREINEAWIAEGRSNEADDTLTKLMKEKKLMRTPVGKGIRGSRYSLA